MNVIGSRPDGWWRDRRAAMRRLLEMLAAYVAETGDEVTVVLDSEPFDLPQSGSGELRVVFASPTARNAGDDEIVRIVERDAEPESLSVVTSDAELGARVGALGAHMLTSGSFRSRLERRST